MIESHILAILGTRLTDRDRIIARAVWKYRVLTSYQLAEAFFDSTDAARKRLLGLAHMGVLERFQPPLPMGAGTAPFHYVIGPNGAAVLASDEGVEPGNFGYRRERVLSIAHSQRLTHNVGVNGVATALIGFARRVREAELISWWPEHRCATVWGEIAKPDAYGRWYERDLAIDFFLEYDNGTEPLDRVIAKLNGYARLAESSGIVTPVLFLVPGERRETNLRQKLARHPAHQVVPIATGNRSVLAGQVDEGPAGALWMPIESAIERRRLAELALAWSNLGPMRQPVPNEPNGEEIE